jgi:hypothetical protein
MDAIRMSATKSHIIDLFNHLPKTKAFVASIIGFEWTSEEQKKRTWNIANQMANIERKKLQDEYIQNDSQ